VRSDTRTKGHGLGIEVHERAENLAAAGRPGLERRTGAVARRTMGHDRAVAYIPGWAASESKTRLLGDRKAVEVPAPDVARPELIANFNCWIGSAAQGKSSSG